MATAKKTTTRRGAAKKPPPAAAPPVMAANSTAVEATIAVLDGLGHLDDKDAALLALLRSTAAALDEQPDNAALVRQYRETLAEVTRRDERASSDLDDALAAIRGATPVGDTPAT